MGCSSSHPSVTSLSPRASATSFRLDSALQDLCQAFAVAQLKLSRTALRLGMMVLPKAGPPFAAFCRTSLLSMAYSMLPEMYPAEAHDVPLLPRHMRAITGAVCLQHLESRGAMWPEIPS